MKARVLVVDDEKDFVNILSKRIKRRNIDVTKAFSGAEAIQALRAQEFDVVVLDLKMEEMDGIETLKVLKIMDPQLAVIMLTGHGSVEAAEQGIRMGAYDYLTKPFAFSSRADRSARKIASLAWRRPRVQIPTSPLFSFFLLKNN